MRGNVLGCALALPVFLVLGPRVVPSGFASEPTVAIKGTVFVEGQTPPLQKWPLDEAVQRVTGTKVYHEETWLVGPNRGLANCVVTLVAKDSTRRVVPKPLSKTVLNKVGASYVPRVLVVTPGTQVIFRNEKSPCQGFQVSGRFGLEHDFNYKVREGTEKEVIFRRADVCSVTCPLRPYAKGYIRVVDTPYFAVTDSEGRFAIREVPPGDYLVAVWHEGAGSLPRESGPSEVTITGPSEQALTFRVDIPKTPSSR